MVQLSPAAFESPRRSRHAVLNRGRCRVRAQCARSTRYGYSLLGTPAVLDRLTTRWAGQAASQRARDKANPKVVAVTTFTNKAPQRIHAAGELAHSAVAVSRRRPVACTQPAPVPLRQHAAAVVSSMVHMRHHAVRRAPLNCAGSDGWIPTEEPRRPPSISPAPSNPTLRDAAPYHHQWLRPGQSSPSPEPRVSIDPDHVERYY